MRPSSDGLPARLRAAIQAHGDGDLIAASALQPGLRVFETSFGVWAYHRVRGVDVTLGGPLCAAHDRATMVRRFLATSRWPALVYLRAPMLEHLAGSGLRCAGIGVDRHVDLEALRARPSKPVRGAVKKARKAGLELRELDLARLDAATRRRLDAITSAYLERAAVNTEMAFLNWPMSAGADDLRRVYALHKHDREHHGMFGYAVLNPIFTAGRQTGWLLDILRFEPTRLWGVWLSVVHALAEIAAREGMQLSVGFAPLHKVTPAPVAGSRALQAQIDWMVRYLSTTPYLLRLRELKDAIEGPEEARYVASFTRCAPILVAAFLEAMAVPLPSLGLASTMRILGEGARLQLRQRMHRPPRLDRP